ncbi:MAG: glucose 1-dehydrogenase [Candidatus Woesearchaeota archaeon]
MKAITIIPKVKGKVSLMHIKKPVCTANNVLVKVLEAGVCRTDLEIYEGLYGEPPKGENFLIMGHESLGVVEETGERIKGLKLGDLVVRTVRRPCTSKCVNCETGETDMCLSGEFVETGIKGLHGSMVEYFVEEPDFLVRVPEKFRDVGVLMEPLSFSEKAVRQAYSVQQRMLWNPKRALVLGAGPIGLLVAMILRNKGLDTKVAAWSKRGNLKSSIVEEIGAEYVSVQDTELSQLGKFDIIIEASGSVERISDVFKLINTNGVLCLTSITGGNKRLYFPLEEINLDMVLGNKAVVGVVNANIADYAQGIKDMDDFEAKWPGTLKKFITRRVNSDSFKKAFEKSPEDIKIVIEF